MSLNRVRRHTTVPAGAQILPFQRGKHAAPPKRSYVKLTDELRERIARALLVVADDKQVLAAAIQHWHQVTGASISQLEKLERSVRRNAAAGKGAVPDDRKAAASKIVITDDVLQCHIGRNIAAAHMRAMALGLIPPCHYTSYRDQLFTHTSRTVIDALRHGQRVLPSQWVYLDRSDDNTLLDQITTDVFFPGIRCTDAEGNAIIPVWVSIRERASGILLSWRMFGRTPRLDVEEDESEARGDAASGPNTHDIIALIGEGIRGWQAPGGLKIGGIPRGLRCDREALFLTDDLRISMAALGIEVDPTNSYSSWENGKHERMHQVIRREALEHLLASNRGPQSRSGKRSFADITITLEELTELMDRWAVSYNLERISDGKTALERWQQRVEQGGRIERASVKELAEMSLPGGTAKKGKHGITLPGTKRNYISAKLTQFRNGTVFSIGIWPGDSQHIEIFDPTTGDHVDRLTLAKAKVPAVEAEVLAQRARDRGTVAFQYEEARRRLRVEEGGTPPRPRPAEDAADTEDPDGTAGPDSDPPAPDNPAGHADPADPTPPASAPADPATTDEPPTRTEPTPDADSAAEAAQRLANRFRNLNPEGPS